MVQFRHNGYQFVSFAAILHDFEFPSSAGLQLPEKLERFKRTQSKLSEHDW